MDPSLADRYQAHHISEAFNRGFFSGRQSCLDLSPPIDKTSTPWPCELAKNDIATTQELHPCSSCYLRFAYKIGKQVALGFYNDTSPSHRTPASRQPNYNKLILQPTLCSNTNKMCFGSPRRHEHVTVIHEPARPVVSSHKYSW
jgi:hypothetical protein